MRGWGLRIAAVALLATPAALAGDPVPAGVPAPLPKDDAAFRERVNKAIDRGVACLRGLQNPDGSFGILASLVPVDGAGQGDGAGRGGDYALGESALALYALRACGVPEDDPAVLLGFRWLRTTYLALQRDRGLRNYSVSLTLLALEAHRNPPRAPGPDSDRYGRSAGPKPHIPPVDLDWMKELTAWLVAAQNGDGTFGYQSPGIGYYDHSNSQYSLLALKAARRCDIAVPRKLWEKALRHFVGAQENRGPAVQRREPVRGGGDGGGGGYGTGTRTRAVAVDQARGWGYVWSGASTGSMTTGGVSSVVICRSELLGTDGMDARLDGRAEKAIWDGLAWLGLHFTVRENPCPKEKNLGGTWHYYYLYGLERAGVLAGVTLMGDHDWYHEGAAYLVGAQAANGGWQDRLGVPWVDLPQGAVLGATGADLQDTSWALLFLRRSTPPVARGGVATESAGDALDLAGAADLDTAAFRDLFDAVFRRYAVAKEAERAARAADFVRMGTRSIPHLVMRLEDGDAAVRAAAIAALKGTTGITQGFDPAAPDAARAEAVRAWQEWWFAKKGVLVADVDAGRFRE